ncbi:MAG TPA: hypothetical protein VKA43_06675 [Gammaproteobacteria bacterium]|nr:hypothetical protein [Gammaproteobacteria bacterium]
MPESRELKAARRLLAEAEAQLASADGLVRLREGLGRLDEVMVAGAGPEGKTARNLAASYASRVYARIGSLLDRDAQLPEPELEHYFKVVLAFDQVSASLPSKAAKLKVAVVRALIERYYEGHPPERKRAALAELADLGRERQ